MPGPTPPPNTPIVRVAVNTSRLVAGYPDLTGSSNCSSGAQCILDTGSVGSTKISQPTFGGTISVKQTVSIAFQFDNATYRPIGIAFKADGTAKANGSGRGDNNLPCADVQITAPQGNTGGTIQVTDLWQNKGGPGAYKWGYYIFFQDSTGAVGMIDPDIENDILTP